jgi:hypothetical protein
VAGFESTISAPWVKIVAGFASVTPSEPWVGLLAGFAPSLRYRATVSRSNASSRAIADGELKFVQEWPFENRFSFLGFSSRLQKGICSSGPGWIFFRS